MRQIMIFYLFVYLPSFAQMSYNRFEHLNLEDGLSQNSVFSILQDQQGFLWFATEDGLNKFDGYQFKIYRHELGNSSSLSDNFITALHQDSSGYIWIGTENGLNRFDPVSETFRNWKMGEITIPGQGLSDNRITEIWEDRSGKIFRSSDNGNSWTELTTGIGVSYNVVSLAINSQGHIFAAAPLRGVYRSTNNGST